MDEKKKRRSMRFGRMFNKTEKEKEKERDRTSLKSKEKLTKKGHKRSASVEDDEGRVIGAKFTQVRRRPVFCSFPHLFDLRVVCHARFRILTCG